MESFSDNVIIHINWIYYDCEEMWSAHVRKIILYNFSRFHLIMWEICVSVKFVFMWLVSVF